MGSEFPRQVYTVCSKQPSSNCNCYSYFIPRPQTWDLWMLSVIGGWGRPVFGAWFFVPIRHHLTLTHTVNRCNCLDSFSENPNIYINKAGNFPRLQARSGVSAGLLRDYYSLNRLWLALPITNMLLQSIFSATLHLHGEEHSWHQHDGARHL